MSDRGAGASDRGAGASDRGVGVSYGGAGAGGGGVIWGGWGYHVWGLGLSHVCPAAAATMHHLPSWADKANHTCWQLHGALVALRGRVQHSVSKVPGDEGKAYILYYLDIIYIYV